MQFLKVIIVSLLVCIATISTSCSKDQDDPDFRSNASFII